MLYVIHRRSDPELPYKGGQQLIVHLEANLYETVAWAKRNGQRWAFTLSNAGSAYFDARNDLAQLNELDWEVIYANDWRDRSDGKQAEFLVEQSFAWSLVRRVGVFNNETHALALKAIASAKHQPDVTIRKDWYY